MLTKKKSNLGGRREGAGRKARDPDNPVNQIFALAVTAREKEFLRAKGGAWVRELIRKKM